MVELFATSLQAMPGAVELLAALHADGVPQALVSSSYRVLVDAVLAVGHGPFAVTVAGDEVGDGKPHPEPYLTAATRLGVPPEACVAIEDSPTGVASAVAAGVPTLAVEHLVPISPGPLRTVVHSLEGWTPADLGVLLAGR